MESYIPFEISFKGLLMSILVSRVPAEKLRVTSRAAPVHRIFFWLHAKLSLVSYGIVAASPLVVRIMVDRKLLGALLRHQQRNPEPVHACAPNAGDRMPWCIWMAIRC